MTEQREQRPWRRWKLAEDGFTALAAYTPTGPVRRLQFEQPDAWTTLHDPVTGRPRSDRAEQARTVLAKAYDAFRAQKYAYNIEADPWTLESAGQAVRDPYAVKEGSGTCIDLAAMFSAICKLNGLRPVFVFLQEGSSSHAMVVVDLLAGIDEELHGDWYHELNPLLAGGSPDGSPKAAIEGLDRAVAWSADPVHDGWRLGRRFVAVDVVAATKAAGDAEGDRFDEACLAGERNLRSQDLKTVVALEVVGANDAGLLEYEVPADEPGRRALHIDLPPAVGDFRPFPSRAHIEGEFHGGRRIVLLGPSGSGKSLLARHVAGRFGEDFGWWLDGSSHATLSGRLAEAESRESGLDPALVLHTGDRDALARSARARLENAVGSWVVVVDNADGDPGEIDDLLPAQPRANQLLVVTTTNEQWDRPGWRVVRLHELLPYELAEAFGQEWPPRMRALLGGLPLLADATVRFEKAAGKPWWEIEPVRDGDTVEDVPARIWSAVAHRLGARSDACRAAEAAAWLPPVDVPFTALTGIVAEPASAAAIQSYGLAEEVAGANRGLRIHRLFRGAMRAADAEARSASAVLRAEAALDLLALYYDRQTIDDLHQAATTEGRDVHEQAVDLHGLGLAVERNDPERAAEYLTTARELNKSTNTDDALDDESALIEVDGLRSLARPAARRMGRLAGREDVERALDDAIAWCVEAENLCRGREGKSWPMTLARTRAMHGIAVRGKGGLNKNSDRLYAQELFEEARELLNESYLARRKLDDGAGGPDVDRAQFNLAGLEIEFAQVDPRSRVTAHLAEARRHYTEVLKARQRRLRSDEYEDIAACYNGLAIADYFTAVLLDQSYEEKSESLRHASENAVKAAEIRVRQRKHRAYDGPDASKSVALLAKISLARLDVNRAASGKGVATLDSVVQFGLEWGGMAPSSTWMVASDGKASIVATPTDVPRFAPVPAIGERPDLKAEISKWIASPPMRALVESFASPGDVWEPFFDNDIALAQRLAALESFTDRWDTRRGLERNLSGDLPMTQWQSALVLNAADALGLRSPGTPRRKDYDYVILLGGLIRACFQRPAYAARLLARGEVHAAAVVALGARRPLGGDEPDLARQLGEPDLDKNSDEFEALDRGTRAAFGLGKPIAIRSEPAVPELGPHSAWEERVYHPAKGPRIIVAAAPSRRPDAARADTADGYAWFAGNIARLVPEQRILAVTTDIYRPYQHLAALRMLALPYRVEVETVGHAPAGVEPVLRQPFSPARYLQEIRSAVQGCRALLAAIDSRSER